MKSAILQLLAIAALAVVAGGAYNALNPKPEKRLPWLARQYKGLEYLAPKEAPESAPRSLVPAPAPATPPAPVTGAEPAKSKAPAPDPVPGTTPDGVPLVDLKTAFEEYEAGTLFLDARKPQDYEAGHIPGARSMFAHGGDMADKIVQLREEHPAEAPIVLYCTNSKECEDSKVVANQLKQVGFVSLMIFQGGFPEWKEKKPDLIVTGKEPGKRGGEP